MDKQDSLMEFYNWYLEVNGASRRMVLNELQRRLGLPVENYPDLVTLDRARIKELEEENNRLKDYIQTLG
jgi:hypothetical protein